MSSIHKNNQLAVASDANIAVHQGKLSMIEYLDQAVMNAKGIAAMLDVKPTTMASTVTRKYPQLIINEDYFKLSHEDAKQLSAQIVAGGGKKYYAGRKGLDLFTETGMFKLAAASKTGKSFEVVQKLIYGYLIGREAADTLGTHAATVNRATLSMSAKGLSVAEEVLNSTNTTHDAIIKSFESYKIK